MFETEKTQTSTPVNEMLDRLEARITKGQIHKNTIEKATATVVEGIVTAKSIIDAKVNFDTLPSTDIEALSNAWKAWEKNGIFQAPEHQPLRQKLQSLFSQQKEYVYARQIWRSEMTHYLMEKLKHSNRTDKAEVMEKILVSQIVSNLEDDPFEALTVAMWLDPAIEKKNVRRNLAQKMQRSTLSGSLTDLPPLLGDDFSVKKVRVVIGGTLMETPLELTQKLRFKRIIREENRIYAQMENGCKGNLVIIELDPKKPEVESPPLTEKPSLVTPLPEIVEPPQPTPTPEEPTPSPEPPLPPQEPLEPEIPSFDTVRETLTRFEYNRFTIQKESIFQSGPIITRREILRQPPKGNIETFYIVENSTRNNPPYYLLIDTSKPLEINVGRMKYHFGILRSTGDYEPIHLTFYLDPSDINGSLKTILDSL